MTVTRQRVNAVPPGEIREPESEPYLDPQHDPQREAHFESQASREERVLILSPTSRDAETSQSILARTGIRTAICSSLAELAREIGRGAGAALFPEEWLESPERTLLAEVLAEQPPWSEIPLLILVRGEVEQAEALPALNLPGTVTLLSRPIRIRALVSALQTALHSRRRQYQVREYLEERERASVALRESQEQLQAQARALQEADRRKDEFLAMLAHELRNPLAPISASVHLLAGRTPEDPVLQRHYEIIRRQVGNMSRLLDDLLEASRITQGKVHLKRETLDLSAVLQHALDVCRPSVEERSQSLGCAAPAAPVYVEADPLRMEQVFSNLLFNASKYTGPDGHIQVMLETEGSEAVVRFRDDGQGIAPELLPHIFDLFTQGERGLDRSQGGLGIGLTLVRSLLEWHGGTVEARSAGRGQGSEFTVRLPLSVGSPAVAVQPAAKRLAPSAIRRVLVVDDNRDAADAIGDLITLWGHDTRLAYNGESGVRAAAEWRPDLVVLDIGLPDIDGCEVARRLRRQPGLTKTRLIALTGYSREEDHQRIVAAGFNDHLVKPLDPDQLRTILRGDGADGAA